MRRISIKQKLNEINGNLGIKQYYSKLDTKFSSINSKNSQNGNRIKNERKAAVFVVY